MGKAVEITVEQAQHKVDAVDKRIDAVRAELLRNETVDEMDFISWGLAWAKHPALQAIEKSLFDRRYDARQIVMGLEAKAAKKAERAEAKRFAAEWDAKHDARSILRDAVTLLNSGRVQGRTPSDDEEIDAFLERAQAAAA